MTTAVSAPPDPRRAVPPDPSPESLLARRAALAALLAGTAVLYTWNLAESGWANAFYAAAAQAGGQSWKAWFFGASDAASSITVDKPPASLWVMGLAVRLFGLSSWSVLVPQALMGVAAVALLYATVRRAAGTGAGLLAGAALAVTPVAALMFRYDNPDALLVLLLVGGAYATLRAVEGGRTRWLVLAGVLIGFAFLTKMLQAFLVVPAFAAVWLVAAPVGIGRRLRGLGLATLALLVSAGWWVLVVELWPADDRPFIGGSQTNSVLELVFGYNGFGRLTGDEVGSVGAVRLPGVAGGGWGETGIFRLFDAELGGQASWLLPAAGVLLVAVLWWTRRAPRTDLLRAAVLLWGGWLVVTDAVFSLMQGIFHPYYLVALAPAIAALVGIGATVLWRRRDDFAPRTTLVAVLVLTVLWAYVLLQRTPGWQPWLAWAVLVVGGLAAFALLAVDRLPRPAAVVSAAVAVAVALAGPFSYTVATVETPHTGAIPSAGPTGAAASGVTFFRPSSTRGGRAPQGTFRRAQGPRPVFPGPGRRSARSGGGTGGFGFGGFGGFGAGFGGGFGGGLGNLLDAPAPPPAVVDLLQQNAPRYTWAAAVVGSSNAASYQLASGEPVMPMGGYNGTDPFPTVAAFQQLVATGQVHWFIGGTGPGGTASGGSDDAQQVAEWVQRTFRPTNVDGVVLYDLSGGAAGRTAGR